MSGNNCTHTFNLDVLQEYADFTYDSYTFCKNESNPLPNSISGSNGQFSSSSPDLIINSTTGEIDLQASLSGTYSITFTTSTCGITRTRTVTIRAAVNVDAGADFEVCSNAQVTLTASGANSYAWYLSSDLNSPLSTNNPYQFNWPFINNNPRLHTVVVLTTMVAVHQMTVSESRKRSIHPL